MVANPFKPTAGASPPLLIGRQGVVDSFVEGLDDGPGAPSRLSLCTGPRGIGKTVMLAELGRQARERGWVVIDERRPRACGRGVVVSSVVKRGGSTRPPNEGDP